MPKVNLINKVSFTFFFLFLLPVIVFAQNSEKKWGIGIDYGSIEYRGELGDQLGDLSQWQSGYGIHISRYLLPSLNFGIRGAYNFLSVTDSDDENYSMNGYMYTVSGLLEYKLANGYTLKEDAIVKPFLRIGGGKLFGNTWGLSMDTDDDYDLKLDDWVYSVGAGARFRLAKHIDAVVDVGNLWVTAVGMDGSRQDIAKDQYIQLNVGVSFAMGQMKDSDRDGVGNKVDQCPDTPVGVEVDELGCPLDRDGDGVPDFKDECPDEFGTEAARGCPDRDEDGIADNFDKCPDEAGPKSNQGCPLEEKKKEDKEESAVPAPNTAPATTIPANGVNLFFVYPNGQGAPQIYSTSPTNQMPFDSDGDGIANNIDKCPNQAGTIDNLGCPVYDTSNTLPTSTMVPTSLVEGCPGDKDCDGISDNFDKCPESPGAIRNKGCPIEMLSPKWRSEYKIPPVHFMTGRSFLTDYSREHVDQLIKALNENPELNVWLFGHADQRGNDEMNQKLSENRLKTIVDYIMSKGINKERIYTMALGESLPASLGQTSDDLKRNRKVDFFLFEFK